jgi:hypothetical protein
MIHQRLKKILDSFALSSLILFSGLMSNSVALAATLHMVVRTATGERTDDL